MYLKKLIVEEWQILINTNLEKVVENYRQTTQESDNTNDENNTTSPKNNKSIQLQVKKN